MLKKAVAYWDESDPNDKGWAYRLYFEGGLEESGPIYFGDHLENALYELESIVETHGGVWADPEIEEERITWAALN
jgi:hypothetical protein